MHKQVERSPSTCAVSCVTVVAGTQASVDCIKLRFVAFRSPGLADMRDDM